MQSKILEYLKVPSEVSDKFPESTKEMIRLLDEIQRIYYNSPAGAKKQKLALLIVEYMRQLMAYLKGLDLGIYTKSVVTSAAPPSPTPEPTLPTPRPPVPQTEPTPMPPVTPEHDRNREPTPPSGHGTIIITGTPIPPKPPQPEPTKEEIEQAIRALDILGKAGDADAKKAAATLRIVLKNM